MAFFGPSSSSQFLQPPPAPLRKKNHVALRDEVDEFLSSDLEAPKSNYSVAFLARYWKSAIK